MDYLISVIIPCYNSIKTIEKCVYSIFTQNFSVFEIICVDDGSTDGTFEKLLVLKNECPNNIKFHIIQQQNSGPSLARNNGIKKSSGNFIAFLDSDDYWLNNKIFSDVKFLRENSNVKLICSDDLKISTKQIKFDELLYSNIIITSSVVVERNCIYENLFDEMQKYSEDYKAWLKIVYYNEAYVISPRMVYSVDSLKSGSKNFIRNGLSSKLLKMELNELNNFYEFYKDGLISFGKLSIIIVYSLLKYSRRLLILAFSKVK